MREKTYTCLLSCSGVKTVAYQRKGGLFLSYGVGTNFKIPFALFSALHFIHLGDKGDKLLEETFKNPTVGNWWITALEIPTKLICSFIMIYSL